MFFIFKYGANQKSCSLKHQNYLTAFFGYKMYCAKLKLRFSSNTIAHNYRRPQHKNTEAILKSFLFKTSTLYNNNQAN